MEVAGIARNIARALRLNEDLTEAIALAHDLGHSPFGHAGEEALDRLMRKHGGFEHNRQSLRVVEELEQKYPGFPGLNLTWEVREGMVKHYSAYDHPSKRPGFDAKSSSLEAQVANLADEIAYYSHDLDDGLDAGLLSEQQLRRDVKLWAEASRRTKREHGALPDECRRYFIIRCLIDDHVRDVVETSEAAIAAAGVKSSDEVRLQPKPLIRYSHTRRKLNLALRKYLYQNLYYSDAVHAPHIRATRMLEELFHHLLKHREANDEWTRKQARKEGWPRAVCDYLAGMTDRFAMQEHWQKIGKP
jgi:dGTPase